MKVRKSRETIMPLLLLMWCLVLAGVGIVGAADMVWPTCQPLPYGVVLVSGVAFGAFRLCPYFKGTWWYQFRRILSVASYLFGAMTWWWMGKTEGMREENISKERFEQMYPQSFLVIYCYLLMVFAAGTIVGFLWRKHEVTQKILQRLPS